MAIYAKETVQDELEKLSREKVQCILRAKKLSVEHDRVWKQEITILAEIIEREYILLEQEWLIPTISQDISRLYQEQDIAIAHNIDRYIPDRFKSTEEEEEHSSIHSSSSEGDFTDEYENRILHNLSNKVPEIDRNSLAEKIEAAERFAKKARARAALEHIALRPDENASFADQINDSKEQDREHVTIDRPVPHGSLMFDAIGRKITRWQGVQQRVFEFPPNILAKDQEYADAMEAADVWMDPVLDLKYSKNWLDWFKAEGWRDTYGKHAAGVMSFTVTNLCATCSDEKTKEWIRMDPKHAKTFSTYQCLQCSAKVETLCKSCNLQMKEVEEPVIGWQCPECDGTIPMHRNLTREQIGDKSSIIVDTMINLLEKIPDFIGLANWYRDWLESNVGGRKTMLSSDLSERA